MSGIMRAPSPSYTITIPLNNRTLQNYDFVVLTGLGKFGTSANENSGQSTLFIYVDGNWIKQGDINSSISVSDGNIIIRVGYDPGDGFYACFLPSPVST